MPHFVDLQFLLEERLHSFHLKGIHDSGMSESLVHHQWQRFYQPAGASAFLVSSQPSPSQAEQAAKETSLSLLPPVFFKLLFSFLRSDAHYSKLLKGVRTFPHRRKWDWYAK